MMITNSPPLALFSFLGLSLGLGLLITPLVLRIAGRLKLVDQPDGRRKIHGRPIPLAGGIAIYLTSVLVLLVAQFAPTPLAAALGENTTELLGLLFATLILCGVGVADDYRCLRGRHKLLGQVLAVAVVIESGVVVSNLSLFGYQLDLGLLAIPFTAFWLLGAINSLNLIDGMDGLLGSIGAIVALTLALMAAVIGNWYAACVAVILGGAVLGFLRYNLPPAKIFLGDCGSMLIGLVIGVLAIQSSLKGPATVALAAPTALLILPIFDTTAAILRRKLTGRSIYSTDRGHLHHCLQRSGYSSVRVLLLITGLSLLTVVGVLASLAMQNETLAVLSAVVVVALLIATKLFGYAELDLVRKRFLAVLASFFAPPRADDAREVEVRLQGSVDWKWIWTRLVARAHELGLQNLRLDVNAPVIHESYHARWDRRDSGQPDEPTLWKAEIPLSADGQHVGRLELSGRRDRGDMGTALGEMAHLIEEIEATVSSHVAASALPAVASVPVPVVAVDPGLRGSGVHVPLTAANRAY